MTKEEQIEALLVCGIIEMQKSNYQGAIVEFGKVLELDQMNLQALVRIC